MDDEHQKVDEQIADPELTDLLGQLDESDESDESDIPTPDVPTPDAPTPDAQIAIPQVQDASDELVPAYDVDVTKYFERYDSMAEEIFAACRDDRLEAQEVIIMCREQIGEAIDNDQSPSRMYVDSLVKAVEVKANVNDTAVKMIDAGAKLLSAAKNQINIQQNNVSIGDDLDDILNRPMDDEY